MLSTTFPISHIPLDLNGKQPACVAPQGSGLLQKYRSFLPSRAAVGECSIPFSPLFFSPAHSSRRHRPTLADMAPSCGAAVPYTLLGSLLSGGGGSYAPSWPACGGRAFLREYTQRGTNALLWAGLLAVTWVLFRRLAALRRLPGPPALLADPGLAAVCRAGGDITGRFTASFRLRTPFV